MEETYTVVFEGESEDSFDDQEIIFDGIKESIQLPDDFMGKMFEYLEDEDCPYQILYQIKSVSVTGSQTDTKPFVAIISRYKRKENCGILIKEENEKLVVKGKWNVSTIENILGDLYNKPELFELVVVTVSERIAPNK